MKTINTEQFGNIEIAEEQCLTITGIIGFEDLQNYALIDGNQPFFWLQSMDDPELCFVVIQPSVFETYYKPSLPAYEMLSLEIQDVEDALILSIVTIHENKEITANLLAPLVINKEAKEGRQIIVTDEQYHTRHDIMKGLESQQAEAQVC